MYHKDTLALIALELNNKSLFNLCLSNTNFNKLICKSEEFWLKKLIKERPDLLKIFNVNRLNNSKFSYKDLYVRSLKPKIYYNEKLDILIKGDYENMLKDFYESIIHYGSGTVKKNINNWLLSYYKGSIMDSDPDLYVFDSYNEALTTAIRDIKQNVEDKDIVKYYADILRSKNRVEVDEPELNNYYTIKPITVF